MRYGVPENIFVPKGVGLKFRCDRGYDMECLYGEVRTLGDALKEDVEYKAYWTRTASVYDQFMKNNTAEGEQETQVQIRFVQPIERHPEWKTEIHVIKTYTCSAGFSIPVCLHYPVAYAITKKDKDKYLTIEFYDNEDNLVVSIQQTYGWTFRCRADRFALIPEQVCADKKKKEKEFDGGCLYCDKAVYVKENGIIYLQCTKYDGRVKETEYEGTAYPEYCNRR